MLSTITLGGRDFALRRFTLRENLAAYPLARALSAAGVIARRLQAMQAAVDALQARERGEQPGLSAGVWDVSEEELAQMADLVFLACHAADPSLTREDFDGLPVAPMELFDAFLEARYCTGAWVRVDPAASAEATEPAGEGDGAQAPNPPTSTSDASSPA